MNELAAPKRKHLFVINPVSFRTEAGINTFIRQVQHQFEKVINAEYDIRISRFPRHAIRTVWRYITQAGPDTPVRVYAVGGDGILFDCLNGIVGLPNADLVPVPYGRTNDFVRAFGEGRETTFRNIPLLAAAPAIPTDILRCGSNYALNLCTVGLESSANFRAMGIQQNLKNWPRFLKENHGIYNMTYYIGAVMVMFDKKVLTQKYDISIDGKDLSGVYANINISNGPCCGGDKSPVITAVPDDGLMDILLLKGSNTLRIAYQIVPYTQGHYDRFPNDFMLRRGNIISIRSKDPLIINLDGYSFFDTNVTVELIKGAVKIAAPDDLFYKQRGVFHE
jgi:diacylglycerol kinase family enzyme